MGIASVFFFFHDIFVVVCILMVFVVMMMSPDYSTSITLPLVYMKTVAMAMMMI